MAQKSLKPFVKATTLEEKVKIINGWETDRGAEAEEYVYDLNCHNDYVEFAGFYGEQTASRLKAESRFWFGGNAFYANEEDKQMCRSTKVWSVTDDVADGTLNCILAEILDSYERVITEKDNFEHGIESALNLISGMYYDLIDFKSYYESENKPKKYRWIAVSSDHAFEDESEKEFDTEEECYNDMRSHALEKMKWNTEFGNDFNDLGDNGYIGYRVRFYKNKIMHFSYSGGYIYKIVPSKKFTYEDYEELLHEIVDITREEGM